MAVLPRHLLADYSHKGPFTPDQIEATMRRHGVGPAKYMGYAVSLFSSGQLAQASVQRWDVPKLRREVAALMYFQEKFSDADVRSHGVFGAAYDGYASDHSGGDGGPD